MMDNDTRMNFQLLLIRHTYCYCGVSYPLGHKPRYTCPLSRECILIKDALDHIKHCKSGYDCSFMHCSSVREAIIHWKQCAHSDCHICFLPKIFTMADRGELSLINGLKLILGVLQCRITTDQDQSVDALKQLLDSLTNRIMENQSTIQEFELMKLVLDTLKFVITDDQADLLALLEADFISKFVGKIQDFGGNLNVQDNKLPLTDDVAIKQLLKKFKFKIIKDQADESELSDIDILKQVFITFRCRIRDKSKLTNAGIIEHFFCSLKYATMYDISDGDIMKQILDNFGCKIGITRLTRFRPVTFSYHNGKFYFKTENVEADKSKNDFLNRVRNLLEGDITDEEDISELLEPKNMKMIIDVLLGITIIKDQPGLNLSEMEVIEHLVKAFRHRIEIDKCKLLSEREIFKRVCRALRYQLLIDNIERTSDAQIIKQILDNLRCSIRAERVFKLKSDTMKQVLDDLGCRFIQDKTSPTKNLLEVDPPTPLRVGIIRLDPLDLLVNEIDEALTPSALSVALSEKMDVSAILVEKTKKWHRDICNDFRNETLDRLVNIIFPNSDLDAPREKIILQAKFMKHATEVEREIFEKANSVAEYHNILAETLSQYEIPYSALRYRNVSKLF